MDLASCSLFSVMGYWMWAKGLAGVVDAMRCLSTLRRTLRGACLDGPLLFAMVNVSRWSQSLEAGRSAAAPALAQSHEGQQAGRRGQVVHVTPADVATFSEHYGKFRAATGQLQV